MASAFFFCAVAASFNEQASQDTARTLYACALETSLDASAHFPSTNPFGDTAEERRQRALDMLAVDCYGFDLGDRTSLELAILDKYEALLSKQMVLSNRAYGDIWELCTLLQRHQATALKLDVTHNVNHVLLPSQKPVPTLEDVARLIATKDVDLILLHWTDANYEHYGAVKLGNEDTAWLARPSVRSSLTQHMKSSELANALHLSSPEARMCLLKRIEFARDQFLHNTKDCPSAKDLSPKIGTSHCWQVF